MREVFDCLARRAAAADITPAVVCGPVVLDARELLGQAGRVDALLRSRGVRPGDRVGVLAERSAHLLPVLLGIVRAGAVYVPVDPGGMSRGAHSALGRAGVRVLVDGTGAQAGSDWAGTVLGHADYRDGPSCGDPPVEVAAGHPLYVIHTSGSTGEPKGAVVFRDGFLNLLRWYVAETALGPGDSALVISSPTFDLTQKNLFAPLMAGGTVVLDPDSGFGIGRVRELVAGHRVRLLNCTPSVFFPLVEGADDGALARLASLRHVVLGGEPFATARLRGWLLAPECRADVLNTYGPTECTDIALFHRLTRANHASGENAPLGHPIPNARVAVVDDALREVPSGSAGELVIGGVGVGGGYLGDPDATGRRFPANPFPDWPGERVYRTGDRARRLPDGQYEFLGRLDGQVKLRGHRVECGAVETALRGHPAVRDAAAVVTPDGQRLVAFVVADPGAGADGVLARLRDTLPASHVPDAVRFLDALPLSRHHKVDRRGLSALAAEPERGGRAGHHPPSLPLESAIHAIWAEALGHGDFGVNDHFLEVGGTSIRIAVVHERLERLLGRRIPIAELFGCPTVRALAARFAGAPGRAGPVAMTPAERAARRRAGGGAGRVRRP